MVTLAYCLCGYRLDDPIERTDATMLDRLLSTVKAGAHELAFDVRDYSSADKQRVIDTAVSRGLDAASDGKFILVRDLRQEDN